MKKLKIVIVSLEMHPTLSARSFRTTELAKELARKGHKVILYTVWNHPDFDYKSFSNETGIILKNLGHLDFRLKNGLHNKVARKLLLYPLIKLIPLVKKSLEKENNIDYLISIAAPHPIHWGTSFIRNKNYKVWTADCGDPFMKNPFGLKLFYFKWLEKRWCRMTDYITVPIDEAKEGYYKEFHDKIKVIPQGFDFSTVQLSDYKRNGIPTFAYAGNVYRKGRDVSSFLEYLSALEMDFKFIVYTKSENVFKEYSDKLGDKMEIKGYIPREVLLKELSSMDFLINIKNDYAVQRPSKLIDYYLTQRPILDISSDFKEKQSFLEFIKHEYHNQHKKQDISDYDIRNVADAFLNLYFENIKTENK